MQSGKSVLWTMAGNIDKLTHTYNCRFFSDIRCLALVCDEQTFRKHMTEGGGNTDADWIKSSIDYNNYFKTHNRLGDTKFDSFDITDRSVTEVAEYVIEWIKKI